MQKAILFLLTSAVATLSLYPAAANAQRNKRRPKVAVASPKSKPKAIAPRPKMNKEMNAEEPKPETRAALNPEPTDEEMKGAVIRTMQFLGGQKKSEDTVGADNPIAGMDIKVVSLEKLGCKPAEEGAGFFCTYNITNSVSMHSNEGTRKDDEHAEAWNTLLGLFMGGRREVRETVTGRFFRSQAGWMTSKE